MHSIRQQQQYECGEDSQEDDASSDGADDQARMLAFCEVVWSTSVKRILAPALHLHRMASGVSLIFPCQVYQLQSTLHSCAGARAAGTLRLYRATTHGQPGDCLEGVQLTSALQKAYG